MSTLYITRDHLYRVGGSSMAQAKERLTHTAASVGVASLLGAVVGYRDAKGVAEDKVLPSLGPIPMDLGLGLGLHLIALSGYAGKWSSHIAAGGDGALSFFAATAAQSVGRKIAEKTSGAAGFFGQPRQMQQGGYRDAYGRYVNGGHAQPQAQPQQRWGVR